MLRQSQFMDQAKFDNSFSWVPLLLSPPSSHHLPAGSESASLVQGKNKQWPKKLINPGEGFPGNKCQEVNCGSDDILEGKLDFLWKKKKTSWETFIFILIHSLTKTYLLFLGEHSAQGKTKNWQLDESSPHLGNKYVSFLISFTEILINICFVSLLQLRLFLYFYNHGLCQWNHHFLFV